MIPLLSRSIKKVHSQFKENLDVKELLNHCLERAKDTRDLNVFITLSSIMDSQADSSNQYLSQGKPRSPLEGIPIAVKDNFCIKNIKTTCGSKMLQNFKPQYTATVVDKLFNSGAILLGKTNMDEFAMGSGTTTSIFGPTKNFWGSKHSKTPLHNKNEVDSDFYICGGSSGGSAVAVASGVCLGALGSDTGGSVRNPASYCGVVGLKPTYGLLSRHGLIPLVNSMDVPGILAHNVEDAALLLEHMAGHDIKDSTTVDKKITLDMNYASPSVKNLKVGIPVEYNCEGLSEEVQSVWNNVAKILESGGATVLPTSLPHTKYSIVCYSILNQCEVASNMARYDGIEYGYCEKSDVSAEQLFAINRSAGFNEVVKGRILAGNYFLLSGNYEKYFEKALKVRRLIVEDFKKVWQKGFDVLLTPTTLTVAPKYSEFMEKNEREQSTTQDYCTQPANMSGCPAISIPIELTKKGLPISIQLMAPNFNEKTLLEAANFIEKTVNFGNNWSQFFTNQSLIQ